MGQALSERLAPMSVATAELLVALNELRAREIAGVIKYLMDAELINRQNIYGGRQIVDLGTGSGAGMLALRMFGAKNVVGVDHLDRHSGVDMKSVEGFKLSPADRYLRSIGSCSAQLITFFNSQSRIEEYYRDAARALAPGGQILVTTNVPESVGFLGGGVILNAQEDWLPLPKGRIPIAEREHFLESGLTFAPSNHYPDRDMFVFIERRRGTK